MRWGAGHPGRWVWRGGCRPAPPTAARPSGSRPKQRKPRLPPKPWLWPLHRPLIWIRPCRHPPRKRPVCWPAQGDERIKSKIADVIKSRVRGKTALQLDTSHAPLTRGRGRGPDPLLLNTNQPGGLPAEPPLTAPAAPAARVEPPLTAAVAAPAAAAVASAAAPTPTAPPAPTAPTFVGRGPARPVVRGHAPRFRTAAACPAGKPRFRAAPAPV